MKNSVKDNSNTLKRFLDNLNVLRGLLNDPEYNSEKSFEENLATSGIDNATASELLQSLEDIEKGRHLITVDTKVSKPRIKKLKTEQIEKVENITNTRMNIQRIETFSNNELEL